MTRGRGHGEDPVGQLPRHKGNRLEISRRVSEHVTVTLSDEMMAAQTPSARQVLSKYPAVSLRVESNSGATAMAAVGNLNNAVLACAP